MQVETKTKPSNKNKSFRWIPGMGLSDFQILWFFGAEGRTACAQSCWLIVSWACFRSPVSTLASSALCVTVPGSNQATLKSSLSSPWGFPDKVQTIQLDLNCRWTVNNNCLFSLYKYMFWTSDLTRWPVFLIATPHICLTPGRLKN